MSAAPTLQNLRIGLKRRQSGKSKVPAKQRGSWQKSVLKLKEHERATFFSHQILNLRNDNLLWTPVRQCI